MDFKVGQAWRYSSEPELAQSRLVIGALIEFGSGLRLVCCSVSPRPSADDAAAGSGEIIPFLPLSEEALRGSVLQLDGTQDVVAEFASHLEAWRSDTRGASYFTVPFEGSLDRLIALQMAALVKSDETSEPA